MLKLKNVCKTYKLKELEVNALKNINLNFQEAEFVAILGPSGCGKTTLLNIIGGLDRLTSGSIIINGRDFNSFEDSEYDSYRNKCLGFVFQNYNLIPHLTVVENVEMSLVLSNVTHSERRQKALELLEKVGLSDQANKKPIYLSGGQKQRVAIARALVNDPDIILADEPTGALDTASSVQVMNILKEIAKEKTVIMVTHNKDLADLYASRIINMVDGEVISDTKAVESPDEEDTYSVKRTVMTYFQAIRLSFKNLRTKFVRTLITSFAGSIGIIGVSLVLSMSNGFNTELDSLQRGALSMTPLIVSRRSIDYSSILGEAMNFVAPDPSTLGPGVYPQEEVIKGMYMYNDINPEMLTFLESIDSNYVEAMLYNYNFQKQAIQKIGDEYTNNSLSSLDFTLFYNDSRYIKDSFDVMLMDENIDSIPMENRAFLTLNKMSELDEEVLNKLGFSTDDSSLKEGYVPYEQILGKEIVIPTLDDLYTKRNDDSNTFYSFLNTGNATTDRAANSAKLQSLYEDEDSLRLKICGIYRLKNDFPADQASEIMYFPEAINYLLDKNKNSQVGQAQYDKLVENFAVLEANPPTTENDILSIQFENVVNNVTNVPVPIGISDISSYFSSADMTLESIFQAFNDYFADLLEQYGFVDPRIGRAIPSSIYIYSKGFVEKQEVKKVINYYNVSNPEKIINVSDIGTAMTSSFSTIMGAVSIVLTAFSSISLIVSSIMIGIITFVSVLERTREIGVLRALGARKKDITRVFNAETLIIGFVAGLLGVVLSWLISIPINIVINGMNLGMSNIVLPTVFDAFILILISSVLTIIAGFIPSKVASKKDPVNALRSE